MNEAETRADHIDPALKAAGWGVVDGSRILREHGIALGRLQGGAKIGAESSTNKIFWSELDLLLHETAMRILGARAELCDDPLVHDWLEGFLFAQAGPIYAGSNEIQRNIIAERLLGLPKN
jgi:alkylation response protein AidB-like acyl-CoA dehydrogenase